MFLAAGLAALGGCGKESPLPEELSTEPVDDIVEEGSHTGNTADTGGVETDTSTDTDPTSDTSPTFDTAPPDTGTSGSGIAGGWSIEHTERVEGARFIHPINTDKDGAIIAARVASALGGLGVPATSDARRATLDPTRMSDNTYVDEVAAFVVDELYGGVARTGTPEQGLISDDVLVLTSVHRYGLYVAEALHARVLPLQFISFADSWEQVVEASERSTVIVGQDYDYDGLWLWNKLAAGAPGTAAASLPSAYLKALSEADELVIVQPDDNWAYCTDAYCWDVINEAYTGGVAPVYLHTSLTRSTSSNLGTSLYAAAAEAGTITEASESAVADLKQWEWGVSDGAVTNLRAIWASLGKPAANLKVIRGGVVEMFAWSPMLWRAYLEKNGVAPRGFHFSSYWVANTQLERAGAVLPFPAYSYWQEDWHPLDDAARAVLGEVCGGACSPSYAENTRAFVNTIGSAGDPDGVRTVMTDFGLTPENGAYFGVGINSEGAADWTGWSGEAAASGWERAAQDVQDPERSPYAEAAWVPLSTTEVCALGPYLCE